MIFLMLLASENQAICDEKRVKYGIMSTMNDYLWQMRDNNGQYYCWRRTQRIGYI